MCLPWVGDNHFIAELSKGFCDPSGLRSCFDRDRWLRYLCEVLSQPGWSHSNCAFFGKFALFIQAALVSIFAAGIDSNRS